MDADSKETFVCIETCEGDETTTTTEEGGGGGEDTTTEEDGGESDNCGEGWTLMSDEETCI